jgi:hypothetical protein
MWKKLDELSAETHEEFSRECGRNCDRCGDPVNPPFYRIPDTGFDLCTNCYHNPKFVDMFSDELLIEEGRCCDSCYQRTTKLWKKPTSYFSIGICSDCRAPNKIRQLCEAVAANMILCDRSSDGIYVDLSDVTRSLSELPEDIKDRLKEERNDEWADTTGSLVAVPKDIGPLKGWTLISDLYDVPGYPAMTAFLMQTNPPYRVASLVSDDHGRVAVDNAFENIIEFQKAEKEWHFCFCNDEANEVKRKAFEEKTSADLRDKYSCDPKELAMACKEFSGYYRLIKGLPLYYG